MWRNDTKRKYMIMFPPKNLARKGLTGIKSLPESMLMEYYDAIWHHEASMSYIHIFFIDIDIDGYSDTI